MLRIFSYLLIVLLSFGLVVNEASAKRFGGGRSFGIQRSHSSLFSSNKTQNTSAIGQKFNKNRWGGMLGGLLVGGLLASLFMGHGLTSGLFSWLLLGAAAYFIINFLRRRTQPAMQAAQAHPAFNPSPNPFNQSYARSNSNTRQASNFVADSFLREAKVCFIRLQTAYDQKNLEDIKAFTLPEIYAEIKMQLDERGNTFNKTEVITLNAELLDVSKQSYSTVASVRFTGSIKEDNDPVSALDEIWHFRQMDNNKEWLVGGIQQEVHQPE